ncbi:MAG: type II secretion system protein GspM [Myxococcota bacterium]|nr:hypothetical protein [Deltaproteobacteria bacterium]MCP4239141.1 type II secretion system protein M [bacterium]MDP6074650.1 type II secretion system protein GspM [Myxococcota bacterium]MDP6241964.1 type II secretion system protein GspM [Myxococcota bacterium]MDP7072986.1 type II secretion system protein GspM [Myxococcota bacterium]
MKALLKRLERIFRNLSARERVLVSTVGALLVVSLLWFGAIVPVTDSAARADGRVEVTEQQLEFALRLRREFDEVQQRLSVVESGIQGGPSGNLRTTLETLAQRASVKIDAMEPQVAPASERYRETRVEVSLKMVSLPDAVRYLHEIESTDQLLTIKALRIRMRPDKLALLDVTFTVSSFEPI